jgi:pimeloyl-ACP methyl ester carboxylesterase
MNKTSIVKRDNSVLKALFAMPEPGMPCKYILVVCHGFRGRKENSNRIFNFAKQVNELGIGVIAFDFTGCGESDGAFADITVSRQAQDLSLVIQYIHENYKLPVILLGRSMGGSTILAGGAQDSRVEGYIFLMPFYLENLLRFSPGYSGLLMTIPPIIMIVVSPLSGNLSDKIGSAKLTSVAFLLMTTAHLFFSSLTEDSNLLTICVGLALLGMGMGSFGSPNNNSIMGSIPKNSVGYAGGFVSTVRNFSFALGIAASVSIFSYFFTRSLASASFAHAYVEANTMVYRTAAVITLIGLLISLSTSRSRQIASSEEK